jgi:hypothetical protein
MRLRRPPPPFATAPCRLDGCGVHSWRACRLCERPVCRAHRFGAGNWFRCYECPAEGLREARRLWEGQAREERRAELARAVELEAQPRVELGPPHESPKGTWRAGCFWGLGVLRLNFAAWPPERLRPRRVRPAASIPRKG